MTSHGRPGFAVWLTGPPAAGKSTVSAALVRALESQGVEVAVLESDGLRQILTPKPTYDDQERERFYRAMSFIGRLLVDHGVTVVFDATANRRAYRRDARRLIDRFVEVFVDTPLEVCIARDPKGIYRKAQRGDAPEVPGLTTAYEPPEQPDVHVRGDEPPERAAAQIVAVLDSRGYLTAATTGPGTSAPDAAPLASPMGELETALIREFLTGRGYDPADLPPSERVALLRAASIHASARMSEIESRAGYVRDLHTDR